MRYDFGLCHHGITLSVPITRTAATHTVSRSLYKWKTVPFTIRELNLGSFYVARYIVLISPLQFHLQMLESASNLLIADEPLEGQELHSNPFDGLVFTNIPKAVLMTATPFHNHVRFLI